MTVESMKKIFCSNVFREGNSFDGVIPIQTVEVKERVKIIYVKVMINVMFRERNISPFNHNVKDSRNSTLKVTNVITQMIANMAETVCK